MNNLITYETLFEILQKEKARKELQKLDEDINSSFIRYLDEKTSILNSQKSKDSIFSNEVQKTEKQVDNIRRIIKDLYVFIIILMDHLREKIFPPCQSRFQLS